MFARNNILDVISAWEVTAFLKMGIQISLGYHWLFDL